MNKKILATAVAIAVSGGMTMSSSAYAGQSAVDGLYGKIRLGVRTSSYGGPDELDVVSGKLVFGFKGKMDLDSGNQFSYGIEIEGDAADSESTNFSNDKSWVAISGGFGKFIMGEHSDMAGFACGGTDLLTHGTAEACELGHNTSPANAVQYRLSTGMVDFGFAYVMDGSGVNNSLVGVKFGAENWSVGGQFVTNDSTTATFGGVAIGESGSAIGGTFQLGDIGLGITVGDDGGTVDGWDFGLYMPLGPGNLAFVYSDIDIVDGTSADVDYNVSMGGGAFWGVEFNSKDTAAEDRVTGYMGINF